MTNDSESSDLIYNRGAYNSLYSLDRLGIFYFVPFLAEVKLTVLDYPSLRALGAKDVFEEYYQLGGEPLTSNGWLSMTLFFG